MVKKKKIAVLFGGTGNEREISVKSGRNIADAINKDKYEVIPVDFIGDLSDIIALKGQVDLVYFAIHGYGGEDGKLQGIFDLLNIPYTGSGALASAMAMDKNITKNIYQQNGIPTPRGIVTAISDSHGDLAKQVKYIFGKMKLPIIVKPNSEGSSVGMSWVYKDKELLPALEKAYNCGKTILIEEIINGTEISVPVYGKNELKALPIIEIMPKSGRFDYESKYTDGLTDEICPARISETAQSKAVKYAITAHTALGCKGISRTDMFVKPNDDVVVIETNTTPGMTSNSLVPISVAKAGYDMADFLDKIIEEV